MNTNKIEAPKVDVLAVMDEFVGIVGDEFGNDSALRLREARAAVAELIDALKIAVRQSSHDMLITGEALRQCKRALANSGSAE